MHRYRYISLAVAEQHGAWESKHDNEPHRARNQQKSTEQRVAAGKANQPRQARHRLRSGRRTRLQLIPSRQAQYRELLPGAGALGGYDRGRDGGAVAFWLPHKRIRYAQSWGIAATIRERSRTRPGQVRSRSAARTKVLK